MAANTHYMWTKSRPLTCTSPTTPASGDPVVCGQIPGVALADEDAAGLTTVALDGVFDLAVDAEGGDVAAGDILYYDAADANKINNASSGNVRFGYALGAVTSGALATIPVEIGY
jgi:predicted RecA/RadA family phage recombinase